MGSMLTSVLLDGAESFDAINFIGNATGYAKNIGNVLMIAAGVILLIIGIVKLCLGLAKGGKGQVSWGIVIACILVGGVLMFGGWNLAMDVSKMGAGTLQQINDGTYGDAAGTAAIDAAAALSLL